MSEHDNSASHATRELLITFAKALKELAEHREAKSRPISGINIENFVSSFAQDQADLIEKAQGPDLDTLSLVTGRVHGHDDDTCYVIEGDNPTSRFAVELLGFDPDTAQDIPEDAEKTFYITVCEPLSAAIAARLKPLPDEGQAP